MRLLITGASGFVGRALCNTLRQPGLAAQRCASRPCGAWVARGKGHR
ncbi:MAG: hypothetical protein RugAbin2_00731 [Rugosibacter sp.]|jgi:uncharacterized protein YbjT (DUF2867 family)|nr:hypothetical protein [Rugosibacter sp.]